MVNFPGDRHAAERRRICFITTLPYQINVFLGEHIANLLDIADITVLTNGEHLELSPVIRDKVRHHRIPIERRIRTRADLQTLYRLTMILRDERPHLVQTMTPKAGLLGLLASLLAGVPVRVHWFTGQVWQNARGLSRLALRSSDRLVARLATASLVDSPSQRQFLVEEHIHSEAHLTVLGKGSVRGVDVRRFRPNEDSRRTVRTELGLSPSDILALFVGRLTRDKGLLELAAAMRELRLNAPNLHIALVGFEEGSFLNSMYAAVGIARDRLHVVGYSESPERFMAAADFLVLPSHREGFGSTVIEAAACGIPAIGTNIHGLTDAIEDGLTGIIVPPRNPPQLARAMRALAENEALRTKLGAAALHRARQDFDSTLLQAALRKFYGRALGIEIT